jgi:hypothetical protein
MCIFFSSGFVRVYLEAMLRWRQHCSDEVPPTAPYPDGVHADARL